MKIVNPSCDNLEHSTVKEVPITCDEYNGLMNIQSVVLKMVAENLGSELIFDKLCQMAEKLLPNSVASIMILNNKTKRLNVLAAPSIPQEGKDALMGLKPGPGGGSCGNAIFHNEPTFVKNTFKDTKWSDIRDIAYNFNICSCWSMPIRQKNGEPIGTFALSSFEHRLPSLFHKNLLQTAAEIVLIVLNLKRQEQTILKNQKRIKLFATALENTNEGLFITDKNNKIIEINNAFTEILGYKKDEVLGQDPKIFASGKHNKRFYKNMWRNILENGHYGGEIVNRKKDGSLLTQWLNISAIKKTDGSVENYFAEFADISELKQIQAKLQYTAFHDELTGVYNKKYLELLLSKPHQFSSLVLLNIDNFSYINLAYGFKVGDELLKAIIRDLKNMSNDNENIFRINSDEFAIICNETNLTIYDKINNLKNYFSKLTFTIDNISLNISFSYGISLDNDVSLQNSALALKKAKDAGKNQMVIFDKRTTAIDKQQREEFIKYNNILHDAIKFDMLVPYFQGILDNKTNKIDKYESLVRIEMSGDIIAPYKFLQIAKLSGMLPEITKIMIDKSFEIMSNNSYKFSINITEDDLDLQYLQEYLNIKSKKYGIKHSRVILEILEGVSSAGKEDNLKQLISIKEDGYKLAIDDFGSEYSNFERVLDLEIDFLKIDAKYIKNIDTDKKSYEIVKSIVYFAKNAKIQCIAEFVHSHNVQDVVKKLSIDYSQGYLFSKPAKKLIGEFKH